MRVMHMSFGHAVYFGRTGAAFPRLTIPSTRQVIRLRSLNLINGVEHNHAFGNFGLVLLETAATRVAAPDFESCGHNEIIADRMLTRAVASAEHFSGSPRCDFARAKRASHSQLLSSFHLAIFE